MQDEMPQNDSNYRAEIEKNGAIAFVPGGNSMWPILKNRRQSVIAEKKRERLKPLDVALYEREDGAFVLHRVMQVTEGGYIICGDSLTTLEDIKEEQVFAKMTGFYRGKKYISCEDEEYIKRVKRWYKNPKKREFKIKCFYFVVRIKNGIKRIFCGRKKESVEKVQNLYTGKIEETYTEGEKSIEIGGKTLFYILKRSKRRTLSIEIKPDGTVVVHSPLKLPDERAENFLIEKSQWIDKHLDRIANRPQTEKLTEEEIKELKAKTLAIVKERVPIFADELEVDYKKVTVRKQKTLWGSCTREGNLSFNCLLALFPVEIIDYVIVHELCHRKYMNHSKYFWAEVEEVIPDYESRRAYLKKQGKEILDKI